MGEEFGEEPTESYLATTLSLSAAPPIMSSAGDSYLQVQKPRWVLNPSWDVAFPAKQGEKADAHQTPCLSTEISKVLVWPIPCRGKNNLGWKKKKKTTSTIFIHIFIHILKIKHPDI